MTEFDSDLTTNVSSIRHLMRWFVVSSTVVLGIVGGWSVMARIDSAVVTAGTFMPQSNAQEVQHPEGGIIGAILVKEGESVREGQVLVRLDAAKVIAETRTLERRLIDLAAEKARLEAERDGRATLEMPRLSLDIPDAGPALKLAVAAEQSLLTERVAGRESQLSQLTERRRQSEMQISGLHERIRSLQEELVQAEGHLEDLRFLDGKGLVRRSVLRQAERDVSRLRGDIGDTEARIASAQSQIVEVDFKIAEIGRGSQSEILGRLQSVGAEFADATEQYTAARDRLSRLEIRAPRAGLVHQLNVHTIGGVIGAGETVMSIIPSSEPLIVSAQIPPTEIDQVHVGQSATVRINAFKLAFTPELEAEVITVSPDQVIDPKSGRAFFTVKIAIVDGEQAKLEDKHLTPGLPAEVLIRGESRRVITYLTQPLTEKIDLAFREK